MGRITRTNFGVSKIIQFTDLQIRTVLADAVVTLVAAIPGAVILLHIVSYILSPWVANYTNLDVVGNVNVNINGLFTPPTFTLAGLLAQGHANLIWQNLGRDYDYTPVACLSAVNQPLTLNLDNNGSGPFTGGDPATVLTVQVFYEVLRIPA
jgi:hypothetical protein